MELIGSQWANSVNGVVLSIIRYNGELLLIAGTLRQQWNNTFSEPP
ncbi:MAG: hypothetical protein IPM91_08575 [Bacteroidetes bacterium]|nr:hypothetical protein [Bacteroidota bacterium]